MATISRLLEITNLCCRISSLLQGSFEKETYNFKEPTRHSHPISFLVVVSLWALASRVNKLTRTIETKSECDFVTNVTSGGSFQSRIYCNFFAACWRRG